jgi:hypothetical protein
MPRTPRGSDDLALPASVLRHNQGESGARVLRALGRGARWGRRAGLGTVLAALGDSVDAGLARLGHPAWGSTSKDCGSTATCGIEAFLHSLISDPLRTASPCALL